ncbi:leucine--tRNA ligase [Candidatus Pacearchaeota archaeon]|nr:leucine--tRNA ligase [Candidatus Pacearchaeota archaeon]
MGNELDFSKIEKKWQQRWEKTRIFEAEPDGKKKFFFTTPYPYISGSLHVGHGRAVSESDIFCRYLRMKGYNVLYPMAFHITGTPVLGISAAIKAGDTEKINLYEEYVGAYVTSKDKVKKIVKSFANPQKIVDFFIPRMMEEYKQLGLSVDWRRQFTSGDMEHQQMVSWQFEQYRKKGYLIKERYPVLYCPDDESAMGEDDIQDADSEPVEKIEFTLLKFSFGKKFLVAATLRPETVFGQTNLWINPEVSYIEAEVGEEIWIMSEEGYEKLRYQRSDIKKIGYLKESLLGKKALAPMIHRELMILPSRFVDADVGTGIVTSVPSDAPYDYVALRELQRLSAEQKKKIGFTLSQIEDIEEIEVIPIITTAKYGDKAAVKVVETTQVITQDDPRLEKLTQEVYKEGYHAGTLNENCEAYEGMLVKEAKEKMKHIMLAKHEAAIMYEPSRKAVSRSGGKIIVALLDNQWFIDFNAPGWKEKAAECLQKTKLLPERTRAQFIDTFAWLDKRPCARKRGLGTPFPFDTNWIIESLSDSTLYMTLYTINHLIRKNKLKREQLSTVFFDYVYAGKGAMKEVAKKTKIKEPVLLELRKSFEYWMPVDQRHTFTLHLPNHLSFMLFAFASIFPENYWPRAISFHGLVVSEGSKMSKSKGNVITLLDIKKKYGADVFRFYLTNSTNIEGTFDWRESEAQNAKATIERVYATLQEAATMRKKGAVRPLFISRFNSILKNAGEKLSQMKLREYTAAAIFDMLRLVKDAKLVMEKKELYAFYYLIGNSWVRLIAPVCPHTAEEVWSIFGKNGFVSLASWPEHDEGQIDMKLEQAEHAVDTTVTDILHVLALVKEKQRKNPEKVYVYVLPHEYDTYSAKILTKRVGMSVEVYAVNDPKKHDPTGKAGKARPGKPGIYVE